MDMYGAVLRSGLSNMETVWGCNYGTQMDSEVCRLGPSTAQDLNKSINPSPQALNIQVLLYLNIPA